MKVWHMLAALVLLGVHRTEAGVAPPTLTTNSWTNSVSGKWETAGNWSAGAPTITHSANLITNATTKSVTIDASTTAGTLTISNLVVAGPAGTVNTLQLTNAPAATFHVFNSLVVSNGGALLITNSVLFLGTPNFGNLYDDGNVTLIGGTIITTNSYIAVGNVGVGGLTISTGKLVAGILYVGYDFGSQGTLTVVNGSQLIGTNGFSPVYLGFSGSGQLTISNSTWLGGSDLYLGFSPGTQGTLLMKNATVMFPSSVGVASSLGSTGTVWQSGGQLVVTNGAISVGYAGVGQMTVSNGGWLSREVVVGYSPGSSGTLTLVGGTNQLTGFLTIAGQGGASGVTGAVWVTGGQLVITNSNSSTVVGNVGHGQMMVSNATWLANVVEVGAFSSSQGALTLMDSTVTTSNIFAVGAEDTTATGAVWLTRGQLNLTNGPTYVGWIGVGQMAVSNGTWRANNVIVGYQPGSQGTLTIAGGTNILSSGLTVGAGLGATGALWLTGGQLTLTNSSVFIGDVGIGQMTVSNGTWVAREVALANNIGSKGILTLAGGTNIFLLNLDIGGATGTVWLTGGRLVVTNGFTTVGDGGTAGQMIVSNGTWRARNVIVSPFAGSVGTLTVAGGVSSIYSNLTVGNFGCSSTGIVLVTGGELHVTNNPVTAVLEVLSGTVIQTGGLLDIDRLVVTNPCAHFIHLGGTLITGLVTLSTNRFADADGDGIDNKYEMDNGLDPLNPSDATLDSDGDGQNNLNEFTMGTDPNDPNSYFHITSIVRTNNDVRITWTIAPTSGNGLYLDYFVQWGTNLLTGITNNLQPIVAIGPGVTSSTTNFLDVGGATNKPARFYRISGFID